MHADADIVLALSMTSTAIRWVFVEGPTGDGAPVDRGKLDVDSLAAFDPDELLETLLGDDSRRPSAIGISATADAEPASIMLLDAMAARGVDGTVVVAPVAAARALATGIADVAGYDDVTVCIVEPDVTFVAAVDTHQVTVDAIDRSPGEDDAGLTAQVRAILADERRQPAAVFVIGSGEPQVLEGVVSGLALDAAVPVFSAAEAELAMARGVALAMTGVSPQSAGPSRTVRVGALTSVLVAAVLTFVVSVSVAVGLRFAPGSDHDGTVAAEPARAAGIPPVAQVVPAPAAPPPALPAAPPAAVEAPEAAPPAPVVPEEIPAASEEIPAAPQEVPVVPAGPAEVVPPVAATIAVAPPPATVAPVPVAEPMAPPAPVYIPPPPVPAPPPPQPRLRDRIIERIPILNRLHEPQFPYP